MIRKPLAKAVFQFQDISGLRAANSRLIGRLKGPAV